MGTKAQLSVVYNSGLSIWDGSDLSTLCIFYDRVHLPHSDASSRRDGVTFARKAGSNDPYRVESAEVWLKFQDHDGKTRERAEFAADWEERHRLLFEHGVIERLPPASQKSDPATWFDNDILGDLADQLLDIPYLLRAQAAGTERIVLWQDHLSHLLRNDLTGQAIFLTRGNAPERQKYKALLANKAFQFLLPKLGTLTPEEILDVRDFVKDTREGFSMHLQTLSAEVEKRLNGGESLEQVAKFASSIVETQLIPGFVEYRRQLAAKRAGFWKKVLDASGKIFQIDAAPWTPKFWGELLKAMGFTVLAGVEEQQERLSNEGQAYQFMSAIDRIA